jgi:hypothetical protein
MPNGKNLNLILAKTPADLAQVRIPGLAKPFEQLTVSELVQLRPGGAAADDNYSVNAVTDNVSVSTSSLLDQLGNVRSQELLNRAAAAEKIEGVNVSTKVLGANIGDLLKAP